MIIQCSFQRDRLTFIARACGLDDPVKLSLGVCETDARKSDLRVVDDVAFRQA